MTSTDEALRRLQEADPIRTDAAKPARAWSTTVLLETIDEWSGDMGTQTTETPTPTPPRSRRGLLIAAAAFAAIVIVAGALVLIRPGGEEVEPATTPPTTQALVTTTEAPPPEEAPFTADDALAVVNDLYAAYDAGDFGAVAALLTPDATGDFFTILVSIDAGEIIKHVEQARAWYLAQGGLRSPVECSPSDGPAVIQVRCTYERMDAIHHAVDAPPTLITENLFVTSEGITYWQLSAVNDASGAFNRWMIEHHPEDAEAAAFSPWTSVEEAEEFARMRGDYAQEWAAYLIANGCAWDDLEC